KSSQHSVPQRKNIAIVGIGKGLLIMMMCFMHIRRNENPGYGLIYPLRHFNICMIEMGKNCRNTSVKKIYSYWNSCYYYSYYSKAFSKQPFSRMVACTCGNIYLGIAMMYHMKFPQNFIAMH